MLSAVCVFTVVWGADFFNVWCDYGFNFDVATTSIMWCVGVSIVCHV